MLNFRNTNIVFVALLLTIACADWFVKIPVALYPILIVLYSLVVFYGCYFVQSNFFLPAICSADTNKKEIAISFDDGPASDFTPEILKLLKAQDVKAAFFCIGNRIASNEALLQQLHQEGHIIGNHSYSHHFWFDLFSKKKMLEDLRLMDSETKRVTGLQPRLFRPPYGVINPNLKHAIVKGGYTTVGWSVRSMDTVIKEDQKLLDKINRKLKPGAVFLFHDTSKITLSILPAFIQSVKKNGYEIVRLDKMLHLNPYA